MFMTDGAPILEIKDTTGKIRLIDHAKDALIPHMPRHIDTVFDVNYFPARAGNVDESFWVDYQPSTDVEESFANDSSY